MKRFYDHYQQPTALHVLYRIKCIEPYFDCEPVWDYALECIDRDPNLASYGIPSNLTLTLPRARYCDYYSEHGFSEGDRVSVPFHDPYRDGKWVAVGTFYKF